MNCYLLFCVPSRNVGTNVILNPLSKFLFNICVFVCLCSGLITSNFFVCFTHRVFEIFHSVWTFTAGRLRAIGPIILVFVLHTRGEYWCMVIFCMYEIYILRFFFVYQFFLVLINLYFNLKRSNNYLIRFFLHNNIINLVVYIIWSNTPCNNWRGQWIKVITHNFEII